MILDRHWWKTADGRLVPDGDPDARVLAYPRGHEIPDHLAQRVGLAAAAERVSGSAEPEPQADPELGVKQAAKPADKAVNKAADKAAPRRPPTSGPGSGVDAWREYAAEVTGESAESLAELSRDELIALTE